MKNNTTKIATLVSAITLAISLPTTSALASDNDTVKNQSNEMKRDARTLGTLSGAGAIGALAGGPIGFVIGATGGALFGEHWKKHDHQKDALEKSMITTNVLNTEIEQQSLEIAQLEKMIAEKMQFQLYFETSEDRLTDTDSEQLKALSDFLKDNQYMHVSIDGHTDPRGTDEFNLVLSEERAFSVANVLASEGIEANRISAKGHGSRFSLGLSGDSDQYTQERKVKVEVFSSKGSTDLASAK